MTQPTIIRPMPWTYNDGGRGEAGYKGVTGDCVCRAIAIATEHSYADIYDLIIDVAQSERQRKHPSWKRSHPRTGVRKPTIRRIMDGLGWIWTPTMHIGSGTTVHLAHGELPTGRLVVSCSRHTTAVIDGVCHDIYDPSRGGTRCVYGYWTKGE